MFYSASTRGFYDPAIHGERRIVRQVQNPSTGEFLEPIEEPNPDCKIPADAVELTDAEYKALMSGQAQGFEISPDENGHPVLKSPPGHTLEELNAIAERNRHAAYVAEADPLFFKAQRGEATVQEWQDKVAEIKERYPKYDL